MQQKLMNEIIQWDVNSWSEIIPYWEKKTDWSSVQNCLELGAGKGGLSLFLALKGKMTLCSDVVDTQITAEPLHKYYNLCNLIRYQDINASNIPYENYFDLIIFKSVIGNFSFDKQPNVFHQIYKALKPNGKLLFAENLNATPVHRFLRKNFIKWGKTWSYISLDELEDFLKIYAFYEVKTTGVLATFGRSEGQRNYLSYLDRLILNKTCPDSWKYIAYGIAKKQV